jgi:hypothetical protein
LAHEEPKRLGSLIIYDYWKDVTSDAVQLAIDHPEIWTRTSNGFRRAFYQAWHAEEGRQIWAALFILLRFSDLVARTVRMELDGQPLESRPRSPFVYAMQ